MTSRKAQNEAARKAAREMNNAQAAALLQAAADKNWESDQEMVAADPSIADCLDTYRDDHSSLTSIADLIACGMREDAYYSAGHLDTAVREVIPAAVWVYLGGELIG